MVFNYNSNMCPQLIFLKKVIIDFLNWMRFHYYTKMKSIDLINLKIKSVSHDYLHECILNLQDDLCELYYRQSLIIFAHLSPKVEVLESWNCFSPQKRMTCTRCKIDHVIIIKRLRLDYNDNYKFIFHCKPFTDHHSVKHLNLIDYSSKMYTYVPHFHFDCYSSHLIPFLCNIIVRHIQASHLYFLSHILPSELITLRFLDLDNSEMVVKHYILIAKSILSKWNGTHHLTSIAKSLFHSDRMVVSILEKLTDYMPCYSTERLRVILSFANIWKYNLHSAWKKGFKIINYSTCPLSLALLEGDYMKMYTLLDFGFERHKCPVARYNVYFRILSKMCHLESIFLNIVEYDFKNPNTREVVMFLTLRHTIRTFMNVRTQNWDLCFFILWSSLKDPYVTKQQVDDEVKEILSISGLYRGGVFQDLRLTYKTIAESYDILPWNAVERCPLVPQPRSLKHLSRCCIRKNLRKAGNLPHGISNLPISVSELEYIRFRDLEWWLLK